MSAVCYRRRGFATPGYGGAKPAKAGWLEMDDLSALAEMYLFDSELAAMKNTHYAEMTVLLIGRTLDWARY